MGKVQEYLTKVYGVPVTMRPINFTAGAVPLEAIPHNPNRFSWVLLNLTANPVYAAFDNLPAAGRGMLLQAGIGQLGFAAPDDGEISTLSLFIVAPAGATVLYGFEVVAES